MHLNMQAILASKYITNILQDKDMVTPGAPKTVAFLKVYWNSCPDPVFYSVNEYHIMILSC